MRNRARRGFGKENRAIFPPCQQAAALKLIKIVITLAKYNNPAHVVTGRLQLCLIP